MKTYYLTREKNFIECSVDVSTPYKRTITLLEGNDSGKVINVHPQGVAWGSMYPRVFECESKPTKFVVHKGRVIVENNSVLSEADVSAVPLLKKDYNFQPFLTDVIDSIHSKENVLLTGGTGVGKTTHINQLAARINKPLLRINFNGETRMSDLIGKIQVKDGETVWMDGVLPMAMRKGYWLLLDELDFADPAVLSLLHPVLEDDPILVLKENSGEVLRPHPNFRLFATANSIGAMADRASSYTGTNQMNEAFLDRWQVLLVDNLAAKQEMKVLKDEAPGLKPKWNRQIVEFANKARAKDSNGESFGYSGDNFSTRKTIAWAKKTMLHRCPIKGAKLSWLDKMPEQEQELMLIALTTMFGQAKSSKLSSKGTEIKKRKVTVTSGSVITSPIKKARGRPRKTTV